MILKRGRVGKYLGKLVKELRTTMYPYTAVNLQESKANNLKDYLSIVDIYGLSHMMMLTNTEKASYLRLAKMPRGPTVTFRVTQYTLAADIYDHYTKLEKPVKPLNRSFNHMPLVIMKGFDSDKIPEEHKIAVDSASMLIQSFFPPINLNEIQLKKCKRVVLFNLSLQGGEPVVEFRHYDIDIEKYSMKKTISNIINNKKLNLSKFENISDYILKQTGYTSCSDNEDPTMGLVDVIKDEELKSTKTNEDKNKVNVKLSEIGPRMNLKIMKVEEGFLKGNVIYHNYMKKSKKEIKEIMEKIKVKKQLKKQRKAEQDQNVIKKQEDKEAKMTEEEKEELEHSIFYILIFS